MLSGVIGDVFLKSTSIWRKKKKEHHPPQALTMAMWEEA